MKTVTRLTLALLLCLCICLSAAPAASAEGEYAPDAPGGAVDEAWESVGFGGPDAASDAAWVLSPAADKTEDVGTDRNSGIPINATNFTDAVFRAFVSANFDTDRDGYLSAAEIAAATEINCAGSGSTQVITSLKGVEFFTALKTLRCNGNRLQSLDLRWNTALEALNCADNALESIDLSNNTQLRYLVCYNNLLSSLNVGSCAGLEQLTCGTELQGTDGRWITYGNNLTALDVSHNPALRTLTCAGNRLTALNVSANTQLTSLGCWSNSISSLDLSRNTALTSLACANNPLTSLNLSANTALEQLHCQACALRTLSLPARTALVRLRCYSNQLTALDLHNSAALTYLQCNQNRLVSLNLSGCPELVTLYVYGNELESLDVSANTKLELLSVGAQISSNGEYQNCGNNLKALNTASNTALAHLYCSYNDIYTLNLGQNTALKDLSCARNNLVTLDTSNNRELLGLYCGENPIAALDLENNTKLEQLNCYATSVTALDVSRNPALNRLLCHGTGLTTLDISGCPLLLDLVDTLTPTTVGGGSAILYSRDGNWLFCYPADAVLICEPGTRYGSWGDLQWTFADGTLTIYGEGEMMNATADTPYPWSAFKGSIRTLIVSRGVTRLGSSAFAGCGRLASVTLPIGLSFGNTVFTDCTSLTSVISPRWANFANCPVTHVTVPSDATEIGMLAFNGCSSLTSVTIPMGVTRIGNYAFYECSALTGVTIPNSVTAIGDAAFAYCSAMTSVRIGIAVTSVGSNAFYGCSSLRDVYYPGTPAQWNRISINSTGNAALTGAAIHFGLTPDFILPASLTAIGEEAFAGGAFTCVKLQGNTGSIGSRAFADCPNLRYIYITAATTYIAPDAFGSLTGLTIFGQAGSRAESFAAEHGFTFLVDS